MTLKLIGNIQHGETYEKNGETKWKNTDLGVLFYDEEKNEYVVKYLGQWCKVWPPKNQASPQSAPSVSEDMEDEIPF